MKVILVFHPSTLIYKNGRNNFNCYDHLTSIIQLHPGN